MRQGMVAAALGLLALGGWLMADTGPTEPIRDRITSGETTVAFQVPAGEGEVHLYIVDGRRHWFGVYQLDLQNGDCRLKVARDFSGDINLLQWGTHEPKVQSVKRMVGLHDRP
jgi:hypothetical protein